VDFGSFQAEFSRVCTEQSERIFLSSRRQDLPTCVSEPSQCSGEPAHNHPDYRRWGRHDPPSLQKLLSLIAMEATKCTGRTRHERPDEE
jgi:hypothetical protein